MAIFIAMPRPVLRLNLLPFPLESPIFVPVAHLTLQSHAMISKYFSPRNDVAFKRIFGEERNKDILMAMLNAVLGGQLNKPIAAVTFLSPYQEPEVAAKKQSIVDVLLSLIHI